MFKVANYGLIILTFLRKSFVQVSEIDVDSNGALLFVHRDNVRYPFCHGYRINKSCLQNFFYFGFNSHGLLVMDLMQFLPNKFCYGIGFNFMKNNRQVYPRNFFIFPGKNILELFE